MTAATDADGVTFADMAADIRNAEQRKVWEDFGREIQEEVASAEPEDTTAVVLTFTASLELYEVRGDFIISPAVVWAVDDVDGTVEKLKDNGDGCVVFRRRHPPIQDIREKVATALEKNE